MDDAEQTERCDELAEHLRSAGTDVPRRRKHGLSKHYICCRNARKGTRDLSNRIDGRVVPRDGALPGLHPCHNRIHMRAGNRPKREDERHERGAGRHGVGEQRDCRVAAGEALAHFHHLWWYAVATNSEATRRAIEGCNPDSAVIASVAKAC